MEERRLLNVESEMEGRRDPICGNNGWWCTLEHWLVKGDSSDGNGVEDRSMIGSNSVQLGRRVWGPEREAKGGWITWEWWWWWWECRAWSRSNRRRMFGVERLMVSVGGCGDCIELVMRHSDGESSWTWAPDGLMRLRRCSAHVTIQSRRVWIETG